jgi:hypothetical protein
LHDEAPFFRFELIDTESRACAAFPLVQAACKRLSLEEWHHQIRSLSQQGSAGHEGGHMAVISPRGAVLAIFSFVIEGNWPESPLNTSITRPASREPQPQPLRRLVIRKVIGCHLPGFDPEAIIVQEGQRLAATCQCDEVMLTLKMHLAH